jgi:hypothetical protein
MISIPRPGAICWRIAYHGLRPGRSLLVYSPGTQDRQPEGARVAETVHQHPAEGRVEQGNRLRGVCAALVAGAVCAAFGIASSMLVAGWTLVRADGDAVFAAKSAAKALLFVLLFAACVLPCLRMAPALRRAACTQSGTRRSRWLWALPVLFALAPLLLYSLDRYPYPEHDEVHHLLVARNWIFHGAYATGNLERGFIPFDSYITVGPPVIVPIAAMMRAFGRGLVSVRFPIVLYFLLLGAAAMWLLRPGSRLAAVLGVLLLTATPGSMYLARTIYGEVPALAFALLALGLWRKALESRRGMTLHALAGVCLGLALLCKSILVLAVFPVAGAVLFDRLTHRRIGLAALAIPSAGVLAVVGGWSVVQAVWGESEGTGSILALFQHFLMFGLDSAPRALGLLWRQAPLLLPSLVALVWMARRAFVRRYDPALAVLVLAVPFLLFWWCFFTPGNRFRYIWYAYGITGPMLGLLLASLLQANGRGRWARVAAAAVLVAPFVWNGAREARRLAFADATRDLEALCGHVRELPEETIVGTTFWPLEKTVDYFTGRPVRRVKPGPDFPGGADAVLAHAVLDKELLESLPPVLMFGDFALIVPGVRPAASPSN